MLTSRASLLLAALFFVGAFAPSVDATSLLGGAGKLPIPTSSNPVAPAVDAKLGDGTHWVSPYGIAAPTSAPAAPSGVAPESGPAPPIAGPYRALVDSIVADPHLTVEGLAASVQDYFHDLGMNAMASGGAFEENASISFTNVVGDVNGDGMDDIALDSYCTQSDVCRPNAGGILQNPRGYLDTYRCHWPHQILVVSGLTGEEIWNTTLEPHPAESEEVTCIIDFVVGTIPDAAAGVNHLLVYRWAATAPATQILGPLTGFLIKNTIFALNATTGKELWAPKSWDGYALFPINPTLGLMTVPPQVIAHNLLVNPILQTPPRQGLNVLPATTKTGLLVQGVGFNVSFMDSRPTAPPYSTAYLQVLNYYQPDEWAGGIDPLTGANLWSRETFQPNEHIAGEQLPSNNAHHAPVGNRSVFPVSLMSPPLPPGLCAVDPSVCCNGCQFNFNNAPQRASMGFWGSQSCCYDVTGDGVPDLVYTVYEWSSTPATNHEGPQGTPLSEAGRLVMLDGATGKTLYDYYVDANVDYTGNPPANGGQYNLAVQSLGDVNGDGKSDFVLHRVLFDYDYRHDVTMVDGATGAKIWNQTYRRDVRILPIGDANKDGGLDFAIFDFTFDVSRQFSRVSRPDAYSRANVTITYVSVLDGRTGATLHRFTTFMAPNDLLYLFRTLSLNGLIDVDGDKVGDLVQDDALLLPDLTMIHRFQFLSGADGHLLFKLVSAGAFAVPSEVGDVTGDHISDFIIIGGDILDLWITTYDGHNGTALWSRRVLTPRTSSYTQALPNIRSHVLHHASDVPDDYLLNFQLQITNSFSLGGRVFSSTQTQPQLVRYGGDNGTVPWAIPTFWNLNQTVVVEGASPASQLYAKSLNFDASLDSVQDPQKESAPLQVAAGIGSFGAALAASFLLAARRWKP